MVNTYRTSNVRCPRQVAVDYQCPLSLLVRNPHSCANKSWNSWPSRSGIGSVLWISSRQTTGVVFWGWGDRRFWLCQEHYQQTDRYLMGWLDRHFVEFPWHLLLQGVLQIYRWPVSERHFAVSRRRDEQCQWPTETILPPSPGILLRTGNLFQLRFHCFSLAGQFLH